MEAYKFTEDNMPTILDTLNEQGLIMEILFVRPIIFTLSMVIFGRALYLNSNGKTKGNNQTVFIFASISMVLGILANFVSYFWQTSIYSSHDFYDEYQNMVNKKSDELGELGYTDKYNIAAFIVVYLLQLTFFGGFGFNIFSAQKFVYIN